VHSFQSLLSGVEGRLDGLKPLLLDQQPRARAMLMLEHVRVPTLRFGDEGFARSAARSARVRCRAQPQLGEPRELDLHDAMASMG
jgi:hypothetical protein